MPNKSNFRRGKNKGLSRRFYSISSIPQDIIFGWN